MSKRQPGRETGQDRIQSIFAQVSTLLQTATHSYRQLTVARLKRHSLKSFIALLLVGVGLSVAIAACSGSKDTSTTASSPGASPAGNSAASKEVELVLVAYSTPKAAHDAIIPKFVEKWQKEHNQTVKFNQSYGGSGSQARAVIDGLEADVVHLALAGDVNKISKAGLIESGWEKEHPNDSIVATTVPALITREGNPKNIKDWSDLTKPDVKWITANPKTSGIAQWNFLTLWNAGLKSGGSEEKAKEFVTKAFTNVPVLTRDAREATDAFLKQGQGDALINYETEIILAGQKGEKASYVVPDVNVSIDTPVAVVDKNVDKHGTREVAEAFVKFLYTPEAQVEFAKVGFRPVEDSVAKQKEFVDKYKPVKNLSTIKNFGGWDDYQKKFFSDGGVFDQVEASIKR